MPQKQLAGLLDVDQSYLSGLATGRKGSPPASIVNRIKEALNLDAAETAALQHAVEASRRKFEIPLCAEPDEYLLVYSLISHIGQLKPAQIRAMHEILKF